MIQFYGKNLIILILLDRVFDNGHWLGYTYIMLNEEYAEFDIWLTNGIERGWVTEPFCNTHEGDPFMTEEEEQEWEAGGYPCKLVVKIKE